MKQRISHLGAISKIKLFLLSGFFIIIFLLFSLRLGIAMPNEETRSIEKAAATPIVITPTIVSTKWWIKTPAMPLPAAPTEPINNMAAECQTRLSPPLQSGMYAYISLVPHLPNRVRAGAGKTNAYLGQIQPGAGVKIIDGPLCVDGSSWWLVETVESDLRGWTVAGSKSEQWVLPCPNPAVACKMSPVVQQAAPTAAHSSTQDDNDRKCTSNRISIGMPTQVKEDNLLVIRSEPYLGSVIGHANPTSAVMIVNGPACAGGAVWWEVNVPSLDLTGWATEANLRPCSKEDACT